MTNFVDFDCQDRVLQISFNRPEKLNALSHEMYAAVADGLDEAAISAEIGSVVITGRGEFFTAGNDLEDFAAGMPKGQPPVMRFLEALRDAPKPVIAAVNGSAIGVGLTMLLHCDLVFSADAASFRAPFPQVGVVPEAGSSLLLPQAVGMAWANDLLIAGRTLVAQEALQAGLVSRIYSAEDLLPKSLETARAVAGLAPNAVRKTKALIRAGREAVVDQMARESVHFMEQLKSREFSESVAAMREKRPPKFD